MFFLCSYVANFLLNDPDEVGNKNIKTTNAKFLQQGRGRGARDYSDGEVCRHGRFGEESEMFPLLTIFTLDFTLILCMTCPKGWRSVACKCSWKDELWTSWQGCSLSGVASFSSWQQCWWETQDILWQLMQHLWWQHWQWLWEDLNADKGRFAPRNTTMMPTPNATSM